MAERDADSPGLCTLQCPLRTPEAEAKMGPGELMPRPFPKHWSFRSLELLPRSLGVIITAVGGFWMPAGATLPLDNRVTRKDFDGALESHVRHAPSEIIFNSKWSFSQFFAHLKSAATNSS